MWCGSRAVDKYSGTSYEHRRAWIEDKVLWLSLVFAISICANYQVTPDNSRRSHLKPTVGKADAFDFFSTQGSPIIL